MKVSDANQSLLRGKIGNIIYYVRNGKTYARRVTIPGKRPKWETRGRTAKQKGISNRFAIAQTFYSFFHKTLTPTIWRTAAREEGTTAPNLFNKRNCGCFDGQGRLVDFDTFQFSAGSLLLPRNIRVEPSGNGYKVTWEEERVLETAGPDDRLWVGVLYDRLPLSPREALETSGTREEMKGFFKLDEALGPDAHVYIFFGRADEQSFSNSLKFNCKLKDSVIDYLGIRGF